MRESESIKKSLHKNFFKLFIPLFVFAAVIIYYMYYTEVMSEMKIIKNNEISKIKLQKSAVTKDFKTVVNDLLVLASDKDIEKYLTQKNEKLLNDIKSRFYNFAKFNQQYYQIRLISKSGKEMVRAENINGTTKLTDDSDLQNKSHRYYFNETIKLKKGEVFLSSFDLNIENKKIEIPFVPMIRFAVPVYIDNNPEGVIVLNYFGEKILNEINEIKSDIISSKTFFLNDSGYYMINPDKKKEWGFMLPERNEFSFEKEYSKENDIIFKEKKGQFQTINGYFTFDTVYPYFWLENKQAINEKKWKLISFIELSVINRHFYEKRKLFLTIFLIFNVFAVIFSFYYSYSKKREAEALNKEIKQNNFLKHIMNSLTHPFYVIDSHEHSVLLANNAAEQEGIKESEEFQELIPNEMSLEDSKSEFLDFDEITEEDENLVFEYSKTDEKGQKEYFEHHVYPVMGEDNELKETIVYTYNITNRKKAEHQLKEALKQLEYAAKTDPLTKLSNRRDIYEKLETEMHRFERYKRTFSLTIADIDNFKHFNDEYGHDCGDFVLVSIAELFKESVRKQDYAARWGGEEFMLLFPETKLKGAEIITEKIRKKIEEKEFVYKGLKLNITMTFGVASYSRFMPLDTCIKMADEALYKGKSSGKNCVISSHSA